jgi:hypothetical protein
MQVRLVGSSGLDFALAEFFAFSPILNIAECDEAAVVCLGMCYVVALLLSLSLNRPRSAQTKNIHLY